MSHSVIFYNGFNLMVDFILVFITARIAYRSGWTRGYGEGEHDEFNREYVRVIEKAGK